jgi:hypothetical protein
MIVPRASQASGFIAGYWTRADDRTNGLSMLVFESEDNARAAADMIREGAVRPEGVTLESVDVRECARACLSSGAHRPTTPGRRRRAFRRTSIGDRRQGASEFRQVLLQEVRAEPG